MADQEILDALAGLSGGGATTPSSSGGDSDILDALASLKPRQSVGDKFTAGALTAANSALLGFGDEIGAGVNAGIDAALGGDFSNSYDSYLTGARDAMGQFAEENPATAIGLEIASGLGTGLVGAAKAGALKAPSLLGRVVRGAGSGAATGAAAGFGYGEDGLENRAKGAAFGGALGLPVGAAAGGISAGISAIGKTKAANSAREYLTKKALDETGAIGDLTKAAPEKITKAQEFVLNIFKDASDDELVEAAARMESAAANNVPLTVFEALDVPQGYFDAKAIRVTRGGRDVAENFLEERRLGLGQRIGTILDDISPEDNVYAASQGLKEASNKIVKNLETGRSLASGPFYKAAAEETPIIKSGKIDELLELPNVQETVAKVRKDFPRETAGKPDNHFDVLDLTKKGLDDKIAGLEKKDGAKYAAGSLRDIKNELTDEIDNYNDAYKTARNTYANFSNTIDWLRGSSFGKTKDAGLLEDLMNVNTQKAKEAGSRLMAKSPQQLEQISQVFKIAGHEDSLKAGVRSAFQSVLDETNIGVRGVKGGSVVDRLFGKLNTKDKLVSLLGEDETNKIWQKIDLESYIDKGETRIGVDAKAVGSESTPLKEAIGEQEGFLSKLMSAKEQTVTTILKSLGAGEKEELTKQIAEELFSTPDINKFNKLLAIQRQYNKTMRLAESVASAATKGGTTASASTSASVVDKMKDEKGIASPAAMAAVGGASAAASQAPWASFLPEKRNGTTEETETKRMGALAPSDSNPSGFMSNPNTGKPGALGGGKKNSKMNTPDKIKQIEQKIDEDPVDAAIYEIESARNPKAKNPKSTAAGGFQLLKSMQKSLGVEDPYDLEQNYKGYKKLRAENEARFGNDPKILYAAHYLGAPVLDKWLKGKTLSAQEKQQVKYLQEKVLPRFEEVYAKLTKDKTTTTV